MRRKKWIILGVCMFFCMINIAGCVKKESKKITIGSSVDKIVKEKTEKKKLRIQNVKKRKNSRKRTARNRRNREGNRHQAVMLIMTLQI
mgnify:FL=1